MKNIFGLGYFIIIITMACCNRANDHSYNHPLSPRLTLSEALLAQEESAVKPEEIQDHLTAVDSIKVTLCFLAGIELDVYPDASGYVYPEKSKDSVDTVILSQEFCHLFLKAMDTLFIHKHIPVIESRTFQTMTTCIEGFPYINVNLYQNGKCHRRRISYVEAKGEYKYEYADIFTVIADSAISIMKKVLFDKKKREYSESRNLNCNR